MRVTLDQDAYGLRRTVREELHGVDADATLDLSETTLLSRAAADEVVYQADQHGFNVEVSEADEFTQALIAAVRATDPN